MIAHHLSGILPFAAGTYFGQFMSFSPAIILTEMSTPFVNARWFFFITMKTGSVWYALNGLMMWLTFLFCRILWLPYGLRLLILNAPEYARIYHPLVVLPTYLGSPTAYTLSCYWFALITKGLVKVVSGKIRGEPSSTKKKQ